MYLSGQRDWNELATLSDVWRHCRALEVFMRNRMTVVALIVSSLLWSSTAMAQQRHVVDPAAMRQAVADQGTKDQQNRDVVLRVLRQKQMQDVASRLGLSVTRAENAVSTLGSAELASLAIPARLADKELAGGSQKIIISTTTLLLIIIIVILVAR